MSDRDQRGQGFTVRENGYDRNEVDGTVRELRGEIGELRRALDTATATTGEDRRLHDPEGAVKRTLAIAQETADRVLHDAQLEADRRRTEADEQATATIAEAEARAERMLADIEAQAAEVREQGIAAARSAIKVERDKATAELAQIRRVRNDLRAEAVELKRALDQYRHQAREASDTLSVAASGPLIAIELPDYVDDEVALAGVVTADRFTQLAETRTETVATAEADPEPQYGGDVSFDDDLDEDGESFDPPANDVVALAGDLAPDSEPEGLADVIAIDTDADEFELDEFDGGDLDGDLDLEDVDLDAGPSLAVVGDDDDDDDDDQESASIGTFLAEVRAADEGSGGGFAEMTDLSVDDDTDAGDTDRFLSELRDAADDVGADPLFDD